MKTIRDLKNILPQAGTVTWIGIRPAPRGDLSQVQKVGVTPEQSLEGDHYSQSNGKRQVTLIQQEHIDAVSGILGRTVDPSQLRRNIVVKGINLLALKDAEFRIGKDVILRGTGPCHPCSRMEENLGEGGYNAMRGHGGITATVLSKGAIHIGDPVVFHSIYHNSQ